jgi:hypothetical protein
MAFILAVASTGLAAGGINGAVGHPVKSGEEAERLSLGSRVTLAYATCKTMSDKAAFDKNPSRYVPQYGDFCAKHLCPGS